MSYTDRIFLWFYGLLILLTITTFSRDWWYDIGFYALLYGLFWYLCRTYPQPEETVTLLILVPIPHLLGALGLYHLSVGTLSWDMIVHIASSFLGVLFFYSFLRGRRITRWESVMTLITLLLIIGGVVEAVEWAGGRLAKPGEGVFFRGAGDYCTRKDPCTEAEDTAKDAVNNMIGLALGLGAVLYRRRSRAARR